MFGYDRGACAKFEIDMYSSEFFDAHRNLLKLKNSSMDIESDLYNSVKLNIDNDIKRAVKLFKYSMSSLIVAQLIDEKDITKETKIYDKIKSLYIEQYDEESWNSL